MNSQPTLTVFTILLSILAPATALPMRQPPKVEGPNWALDILRNLENVGNDDSIVVPEQPSFCRNMCPPFSTQGEEPTYHVRKYAAAMWLGTLVQGRGASHSTMMSAEQQGLMTIFIDVIVAP